MALCQGPHPSADAEGEMKALYDETKEKIAN